MYCPNKRSPKFYASHVEDVYTDLGYDYRGNILKKTTSPVIYQNEVNKSILSKVELIFDYLVDAVKQIRTQHMISVDKNDRNVN